MKTLEECKHKVVNERGWSSWRHFITSPNLSAVQVEEIMDEVLKLYAKQLEHPTPATSEAVEQVSYWYCPECKKQVDGSTVTFQELHEKCGYSVKYITQPFIKEAVSAEEKLLANMDKHHPNWRTAVQNEAVDLETAAKDFLKTEIKTGEYELHRVQDGRSVFDTIDKYDLKRLLVKFAQSVQQPVTAVVLPDIEHLKTKWLYNTENNPQNIWWNQRMTDCLNEIYSTLNVVDIDFILNDILNGIISGRYKPGKNSNDIAKFVSEYLTEQSKNQK